MSYAAFRIVHEPTGVDNCVSAYLTHCAFRLEADQDVDGDVRQASSSGDSVGVSSPASSSYWGLCSRPLKNAVHGGGSTLPNLVISKANVLEVYQIRVQEGFGSQNQSQTQNGFPSVLAVHGSWAPTTASPANGGRRGGLMAGVLAVWLELVCAHRYCAAIHLCIVLILSLVT